MTIFIICFGVVLLFLTSSWIMLAAKVNVLENKMVNLHRYVASNQAGEDDE